MIIIYTYSISKPHCWLLTSACPLTRCINTWSFYIPRLEKSEVKSILSVSLIEVKAREGYILLSSSLLDFLRNSVIHRLCSKSLKFAEKCRFNTVIAFRRGNKIRMSLVAMLNPCTLKGSMPWSWFFVLRVFLEEFREDFLGRFELFNRELNLG